MANITPQMSNTYIFRNGGNCPFCGSEDIHALHEEVWEDTRILDPIVCLECNRGWTDVYTLTHIEPYPNPSTEVKYG